MAYVDSAPSTSEVPIKGKEAKKPSARMRRYWREIEAYAKAADEWKIQGETIVKLYLDQHRSVASPRRFALLWSNIETLRPAVYGKLPVVLCSRRYKDSHPVGRIAAEMLERASNATFDLYGADEVFRMVRDDRLLVGRGQAWVRYEADTEGDRVLYEKACIDYVHWTDFGHNVCGTWKDVWLAWRRVYMAREEAVERFGEDTADKLTYSAKPSASTDTDAEGGEDKACIFEIWDKRKKQVVWMSKDYPKMLDEGPPPLDFRDFFPCPEPCYGSKASKSLIPTPDYRYYQDQANEIDDLTEKIAGLCDYLIVRGFVPAGPSGDGADAVRMLIEQMQAAITSNKSILVPVESWAGFTEKGGARGLIDWMPIEQHVVALKGAIEARNQLVQDVYQITGIADILRGQTDPDETLGAQQLKAQSGSRRVRNAKDDISRFCKQIAQLVAEVVSEQFQPQTIADMTGFAYMPAAAGMSAPPGLPAPFPQPPGMNGGATPSNVIPMQPGMMGGGSGYGQQQGPPPSGQSFDDTVVELLRNDRMRGFLIDIETDSTIQPDEDAEKQRRTEFIAALSGFLQQAAPIVAATPVITPMITELLLFGVRGYRVARSMEDVIERTMQQVQQQASQPRPNPEAEKMQADAQNKQAEMKGKMIAEHVKAKLEREKAMVEAQFKERELELKREEITLKAQADQLKAMLDKQMADNKMQTETMVAQQKMQQEAEMAALDAQIKQNAAAQDQNLKAQKAMQDMQFSEAEFTAKQEREKEEAEFGRTMKINEAKTKQDLMGKAFDSLQKRKKAN